MTQLLLPILAVLAGLVVLTVSSDRFVKGAATVARHFGISPLVIGIVIIGFGTSLPEMLVSALSALEGSPGLALGNAYGSNVANVALILGVSGLISPLTFSRVCQRRNLPLLVFATICSGVMLYDWLSPGMPRLSRLNSLAMLALFGVIMWWTMRGEKQDAASACAPGWAARLESFVAKHGKYGVPVVVLALLVGYCLLWGTEDFTSGTSRLRLFGWLALGVPVLAFTIGGSQEGSRPAAPADEGDEGQQEDWSIRKAFAWIFAGLALLLGSSYMLVWGATAIAKALGVSDLVIGLTIVAVGTSLPELAAAIAAARQKESDLAVGNVLGSNRFNTLVVVGIAGSITPFDVPPEVLSRDVPAAARPGVFWEPRGGDQPERRLRPADDLRRLQLDVVLQGHVHHPAVLRRVRAAGRGVTGAAGPSDWGAGRPRERRGWPRRRA